MPSLPAYPEQDVGALADWLSGCLSVMHTALEEGNSYLHDRDGGTVRQSRRCADGWHRKSQAKKADYYSTVQYSRRIRQEKG